VLRFKHQIEYRPANDGFFTRMAGHPKVKWKEKKRSSLSDSGWTISDSENYISLIVGLDVKEIVTLDDFAGDEKFETDGPGVITLTDSEIDTYYRELQEGWSIVEKDCIKRLEKSFKFKNFDKALKFTNKVGEFAEQEQVKHHPDLLTRWGKVTVRWWTYHHVKGLHKNDFIAAAKTDELYTNFIQSNP
jgi:4a-hydroxytetrahydrobiopterin dehydratase